MGSHTLFLGLHDTSSASIRMILESGIPRRLMVRYIERALDICCDWFVCRLVNLFIDLFVGFSMELKCSAPQARKQRPVQREQR